MNDNHKKNWIIVAAFALPIILILGVVASTYIPSLLINTDYNFVYSTCGDRNGYYGYNCDGYLQSGYTVENGKIKKTEIDPEADYNRNQIKDINEGITTRLFLHDTKSNESREITIDQAQNMSLSPLLTSPDEVTVSSSYQRGGDFLFLFGGQSNYGYYLTKGRTKQKLNLINSDDRNYYQDNFKFIGWVISQ